MSIYTSVLGRLQYRLLSLAIFGVMLLVAQTAQAFSIRQKNITDNMVRISLNGQESAIIGDNSPYIRIGDAVGDCLRQPGLENWNCQLPITNSFGIQKVYIMSSRLGPDISSGEVNLIDSESVYVMLTDPAILTTKSQLGESYFVPYDKWINALSLADKEQVEAEIQYRGSGYSEEDIRDGITYTPRSAQELLNDPLPSRMLYLGNRADVPEVCRKAMTKVKIKGYFANVASFPESSFSTVPTREPTIGSNSGEFFDTRVYSLDEGIQRNKVILSGLNLPPSSFDPFSFRSEKSELKDPLAETYFNEPESQRNTIISSRRSNFRGVTVYVLDTFDSYTNTDTFYVRGLRDHGRVVSKIIGNIIGDKENITIKSLNVCPAEDGSCDMRYIIDGVCQAGIEALRELSNDLIYRRKIFVNMSFSTYAGGDLLKNVMEFARYVGVNFIVANGNRDVCSLYIKDTSCHLFPADFANDEQDISMIPSGKIITVGALEPKFNSWEEGDQFADYDRATLGDLAQTPPSLYAPGVYYTKVNDSQTVRRFGTSFAAPYVTGILALWTSVYGGPPDLPCHLGAISGTLGIRIASYPKRRMDLDCIENALPTPTH